MAEDISWLDQMNQSGTAAPWTWLSGAIALFMRLLLTWALWQDWHHS